MRQLLLQTLVSVAFIAAAQAKPTVWIIGDSTVRNNTRGQMGWGDPLVREFDPAKVTVTNKAIGGRSSRSFLTEGRWDEIVPKIEKGDFVLMQFGHNDGGDFFKGDRPRASIKGNGEETKTGVVEATGKTETVHSYGWYIRKYAADAKDKGATAIVISPIPRNIWKHGRVGRADKDYALWAAEAAKQAGAKFIPFNTILADKFDALGEEKTSELFAVPDHTHTNAAGAEFNAHALAEAIRKLPGCQLGKALLAERGLQPARSLQKAPGK